MFETGAKLIEEWRQARGKDVGELRSHQDVRNINFPNDDLVMDKMEINLNMLHALVLNWVGRQIGRTNIVTIDKCAMEQRGV
jgi:hypothetical protein